MTGFVIFLSGLLVGFGLGVLYVVAEVKSKAEVRREQRASTFGGCGHEITDLAGLYRAYNAPGHTLRRTAMFNDEGQVGFAFQCGLCGETWYEYGGVDGEEPRLVSGAARLRSV